MNILFPLLFPIAGLELSGQNASPCPNLDMASIVLAPSMITATLPSNLEIKGAKHQRTVTETTEFVLARKRLPFVYGS